MKTRQAKFGTPQNHQQYQSKMHIAFQEGNISQRDINQIIDRFKQYEVQTLFAKEAGIPPDSLQQIKARNIITDKTSLQFNKQVRRNAPRSPSNSLLHNLLNK